MWVFVRASPRMLEWNIQSRAHQCQITGKTFATGEMFHTVLLDAKDGFERLDLSATAWKDQGAEITQRPHFISHWVSAYEPPPAVPPEAIRKDDAESLLRGLLARKDERYVPVIFILAVMLERKKILRMKSQLREKRRRVIAYEHVKSGDLLLIQDPDLQLAQLETVQHDVAHLLEHGLPPMEGAPEALHQADLEALQVPQDAPPEASAEASPEPDSRPTETLETNPTEPVAAVEPTELEGKTLTPA